MPPPPGIGGVFSFSFFSTTTHSVVRSNPAMDAAFCSAVRVTLVGSMTPAATRSSYSSIVVQLGRVLHLADHDRRLGPGVLRDDPDRLLERAADDLDAGLLVVIGAPDLVERLLAPQERNAAARHDALLDRGAGRMQRVLDPGLLLLHLGLGGRAHVDHRDAARQLREPLLQLLLVVIRRGLLDRRAS